MSKYNYKLSVNKDSFLMQLIDTLDVNFDKFNFDGFTLDDLKELIFFELSPGQINTLSNSESHFRALVFEFGKEGDRLCHHGINTFEMCMSDYVYESWLEVEYGYDKDKTDVFNKDKVYVEYISLTLNGYNYKFDFLDNLLTVKKI